MHTAKRKLGLISGLLIGGLILCLIIFGNLGDKTTFIAEATNEVNPAATFYPARRLLTLNTVKTLTIVDAGESQTLTTEAKTVQQVLEELQIKLGSLDRVEPGLPDEIQDTIKITRVEKKKITEEAAIDYAVEKKEDPTLLRGEQRVLAKGQKGLEKSVFEIVLEDGKEISKELIEKILVKEPKVQVIAYGNKSTVSRGNQEIQFDRTLTMTATAYTHTGNKTYTGVWPSVGIVAVDPKVIPLGTRLYIDGYGYATAMDIGSAIKGNRIDLFYETRSEALRWGRRKVQVFVLK